MNVLEQLRPAFAAATPEGGDPRAFAAGRPAQHRPEVRRLPGQRLHGDRQGGAEEPARGGAGGRRGRRPRPDGRASPRSPGPDSSTSGSGTTGSRGRLGDLLDDPKLGLAPPRDAEDGGDRLLVAQRRQADARRPPPLDGDRREPGPDLRGARPQGHPRQPPGRLGLAVRDDPLGLEEPPGRGRLRRRPRRRAGPALPAGPGPDQAGRGRSARSTARRSPSTSRARPPRPPPSSPSWPRGPDDTFEDVARRIAEARDDRRRHPRRDRQAPRRRLREPGPLGAVHAPLPGRASRRSTTGSTSATTSTSARASTTRCSPRSSRTWRPRAWPSRARGRPSSSPRGSRPR